MKAALIYEADGLRSFAIILQGGDEVMRALADYARQQRRLDSESGLALIEPRTER